MSKRAFLTSEENLMMLSWSILELCTFIIEGVVKVHAACELLTQSVSLAVALFYHSIWANPLPQFVSYCSTIIYELLYYHIFFSYFYTTVYELLSYHSLWATALLFYHSVWATTAPPQPSSLCSSKAAVKQKQCCCRKGREAFCPTNNPTEPSPTHPKFDKQPNSAYSPPRPSATLSCQTYFSSPDWSRLRPRH